MRRDPFTRRDFLAASAAGAGLALLPSAVTAAPRTLRAREAQVALAGAAHPRTAVWGYEGSVPGPALRFRQGERLRIELENLLPADTTVHFHGIRLPNAMDGVPDLTQPPIAARGGKFVYEFALPDAGTYWYHPHLGSPEQVGRGLYGALVVEEVAAPVVDRDLVWVFGDWRLDREARIVADFGNFMDASHAGRIGNTVTVNGAVRETFEVRAGERLRLRLVNAANARIFGLDFHGHDPLARLPPARSALCEGSAARRPRGRRIPEDRSQHDARSGCRECAASSHRVRRRHDGQHAHDGDDGRRRNDAWHANDGHDARCRVDRERRADPGA